MLLKLKNLEKIYKLGKGNTFKALKGIDLEFGKGELVSIIGESGSGKSTLMNLIGGLDLDYKGEISFLGNNLNTLKEKEIDAYRKNKIGFIFQSFNLISHLTVLENVTMGMQLSGESNSARKTKGIEILKKVGLGDQINKKPNQLSGGQMQRVAIARALINEPDIILADEPTGALDSETSAQILDLIKEISDEGKLVIIVTHSQKVAKSTDRIITVADGNIIEDSKDYKISQDIEEDKATPKKNLSYFSSIKLALNNMKEKKGRNILIAIGASIGIASIIIMLSLGNGIEQYMTQEMEGLVNPLVVEVNQESDDTAGENQPPGAQMMMTEAKPFDKDDIKTLKAIDNVKEVEKGVLYMSMKGNYLEYKDNKKNVMITSTVSNNMTKGNIEEGRLPKENEIIIDRGMADLLNEDVLNKKVEFTMIIDNKEIVKTFKVSGIYAAAGMGSSGSVYINYNDLEKWTDTNDIEIEPTVMYLLGDSDEHISQIKDDVADLGYEGAKQEQILKTFKEMINIISYVLAAIAGIALLVSAIMILVVLYISVVERTKEIGLLKALGARRKDIKRIFSSEAFLIGLFSGIIGVISSFIFSKVVNIITVEMFNINVVSISMYYIIFGIAVSVIVSVIAGIYPASRAARLDPVEALRRE